MNPDPDPDPDPDPNPNANPNPNPNPNPNLNPDPTRSKGSVAEALDLLMERHVTPFATFEVRDELSLVLKSKAVRVGVAKYREEREDI